jgi:hypothetical protein
LGKSPQKGAKRPNIKIILSILKLDNIIFYDFNKTTLLFIIFLSAQKYIIMGALRRFWELF